VIRPAVGNEFRAGRSEGPLCCVAAGPVEKARLSIELGARQPGALARVPGPSGRYRDADLLLGTPRVVRRRGVVTLGAGPLLLQ
jgi:hypothetical protein